MRVLIFSGSPRKNGNTETLIKRVINGIEAAGSTCEVIRLAERKIHPCIACGGCEKEGNCVINDDMQGLYTKITEADRIIVASPIYFYGITAQAKAFVDRCQALWSRKYLLNMHLKGPVPKIGYFVSVAATKGERVFEGAIFTLQYGFDAMDFSYGGEFVIRGVDKKGKIAEMQDELDRATEFGSIVVEK